MGMARNCRSYFAEDKRDNLNPAFEFNLNLSASKSYIHINENVVVHVM
jgi:hypothetical protein